MYTKIGIALFVISSLTSVYNEEIKCPSELSVDITDGVNSNGEITKDGIRYTQENYYQKDGRIYGCTCNIKNCLRKCCPLGTGMYNRSCETTSYDVPSNIQQHITQGIGINNFFIIDGMVNCTDKVRFLLYSGESGQENFTIKENGYLTWENQDYDAMEYCLDYFIEDDIFTAVLCGKVEQQRQHTIGMIISMPFLLATFLVYALLPDRNLPAKALMCYVLSLLFAYILLVTIQLNAGHKATTCISLAFFCYYFFMASFFWMNSSCLDIFFTFSGIRGLLGDKKKEHKRFAYYSAYAWGVPLLMVGFASIFTFAYTDANNSFYTGLGQGQCWFRNGWATGIYFYFPIAILLIVNMVLFGVTTYKIKRVQKDTKMLKNVDSRKHKYDNNDKQRYDTDSDLVYLTDIELRENHQSDTLNMYDFLEEDSKCFSFNLYVKLLFAMGINWSMEVISWAIMWKWSNVPDYVWVLTDFCNAVYGVFIFFIFVFKRNIWMLLKKRYLQLTGRPQQAHNLTSTHRTTVSQVSSSEA